MIPKTVNFGVFVLSRSLLSH